MAITINFPVMKDGVAPTVVGNTPWAYVATTTNEVVDVDLIGRNFHHLAAVMNGDIHTSNFRIWEPGLLDGWIPETKVQFREFISDDENYPYSTQAIGVSHSHDGVDSTFVGVGAVDQTVTQLRSFGSWMCPIIRRSLWVFHGRVDISAGAINSYSVDTFTTVKTKIEIPYNPVRIDDLVDLPLCRAFVTPYCAVKQLYERFSVQHCAVQKTNDTYYLDVWLRFKKPAASVVVSSGLGLFWVVTMVTDPQVG